AQDCWAVVFASPRAIPCGPSCAQIVGRLGITTVMPRALTAADREALILANDRIALTLARKYWRYLQPQERRLIPFQDLLQTARLGLCKAARKFDPDRSLRFITYAWTCARGELLHYLRDFARPLRYHHGKKIGYSDLSWSIAWPRRIPEDV